MRAGGRALRRLAEHAERELCLRVLACDRRFGRKLHHRQSGEHEIKVPKRRLRVRQHLVGIAPRDRLAAPVVGVVVHKHQADALRARRGQPQLRPGFAVLQPQRAVKRVFRRVIGQRHAVHFKRRHQRHVALLARVLDGPDRFNVLWRLLRRRHIRRAGAYRGGQQCKQRQHARQQSSSPHARVPSRPAGPSHSYESGPSSKVV